MIDIIQHYPMGEKGLKVKYGGSTYLIAEIDFERKDSFRLKHIAIPGITVPSYYWEFAGKFEPLLLPKDKLSEKQLIEIGKLAGYSDKESAAMYGRNFISFNNQRCTRDSSLKIWFYLYSQFVDVHDKIITGEAIDCTESKCYE